MTQRQWLRWAILAVVLALIAGGLMIRDDINRETVAGWLEGLGPWAGVAFVGSYALGAVAFLPGMIFTVTGGALFGPLWGTVYSVLGANLGAALAFLAARHGLADWVAHRTGPRLEKLQQGIDAEGWRFVALVRLVPLVPFNLLNYALGLTRVRFLTYCLTSLIAMAPAVFGYVWVGHAGRQAIAGDGNVFQSVMIAIALIAVLAFVPRLIRSVRGSIPGEGNEPKTDSDKETH